MNGVEHQLIGLLAPLGPHLEEVERILEQMAVEAASPLDARLREAMQGGKRLRPALVLLAGQVFAPSGPPIHKLAAAVETLHTATLVHDDVVDGSHLRRGRPTMHRAWSVGATVLAGDYMLARAAGLVAEIGQPRLLRILTDALRAMCNGEIQQMFAEPGREQSRAAYHRTIDAKTASLLAAATEMAAWLSGGTQAQAVALRQYGRHLGLAFQITDDVLDFMGDESVLGKTPGEDLRQGVATLPLLLYLEQTRCDAGAEALLAEARAPAGIRALSEAVRGSGAIAAALDVARDHAREAERSLDRLPQVEATGSLRALAGLMVERRR